MRKTTLIAIGIFLLLVTQVGVALTSTGVSESDINLSSTDKEGFFDSNEKTLSNDDAVDYDQDDEGDDNFQGNEREVYDEYTDDDIEETPPVAVFDYSPSDPKVGDVVLFDGRKSYDVDGKIVQYKWSYTTVGVFHYPIRMGTGVTVKYSWDKPGDYLITLNVVDDDGLTGVFQRKVHVEKVFIPPSAEFTFNPSNPMAGETVTFDGSKSTDDDGEIIKYLWSYITVGVSHYPVAMGTGEKISYLWSKPGDYLITLEVVDNDGFTDKTQKEIHVEKVSYPPQADFTFTPSTPKTGEEVFFDASGSNDDEGITSYEWVFGDGSTGSGEIVTHTYSVAATYTVKLTVKDDDGLIDTCTKTVHVEEDDEPEEDTDGDGIPDSIDPDDDDDGWSDEEEIEYGTDPKDANDYPLDTDGDHIPDSVDEDDDNDGVEDADDVFPKDPDEWEDTDGDGTGDNADPDDDDDGWSDEEEIEYGTDPKDPDDYPKDSNEDADDSEEDQGQGSHSTHKSQRHRRSCAEPPQESDNLEEETAEDSNVSGLSYILQHWDFDDSQNQYTNAPETASVTLYGGEKEEAKRDNTLLYYVAGVVGIVTLIFIFSPGRKKDEEKIEIQTLSSGQPSATVDHFSKEEIIYVPKKSTVVSEVFSS